MSCCGGCGGQATEPKKDQEQKQEQNKAQEQQPAKSEE